jgi:1,2-diacylglycerol 3-alpha-glucosyltransferase
MRLVIHFARFGPYHLARLRAAAAELGPLGWEVIGLQTASLDTTYDWRESIGDSVANGEGTDRVLTIFPGRVYEEISTGECLRQLFVCLSDLAPDVLAVPGWGTLDACLSLAWCRIKGARAVIMSETREVDGRRRWPRESIKAMLVRQACGALVGGEAHRDYLIKLGIPASRIVTGYNVVDNTYFASEAARWRGGLSSVASAKEDSDAELPRPYFLASNRFIERKNLVRLIEAYARYVSGSLNHAPGTGNEERSTPWSLCLLGDGQMKPWLMTRCRELGLNVIESAPWELETSNLSRASETGVAKPATAEGSVFFPGFRQIEELPRFYAHAGAFIHPALEEPWGLVVNEAMACGLPVLSGNNVGAAAELVREGITGWTFDATNVAAMAETMGRLAALSEEERLAMGKAGAAFLEERCPTRAFGVGMGKVIGCLAV